MPQKLPLIDLPIYTYRPLQDGRKYIAVIGQLPMNFKGDTEELARAKADEWRLSELAKTKKAEIERAEKAVASRQTRKETANA